MISTTSPSPKASRGLAPRRWTLILDRPRGGSENMAIDQRLLDDLEADPRPRSVLRLYRWDRPTVSVGKHQRLRRAADLAACQRLGVPVVRRPTGGRSVLHDRELTYAVLSNDPALFAGQGVLGTYRRLALALQRALCQAGADCRLARPVGGRSQRATEEAPPEAEAPAANPSPARGLQLPCFTAPSRYELMVGGRKVAGSAQRRLRRAFLQHGSVPLQVDYAFMAQVLGSDPVLLRRTLVSVSSAAGCDVTFEQLARAMAEAFQEVFPGHWRRRS